MKYKLIFLILLKINFLFSQEVFVANYSYTDNKKISCNSYLYSNNKECAFKIGDYRPLNANVNISIDKDLNINEQASPFFYYSDKISTYRFVYNDKELLYKDDISKKLKWVINKNVKKKIAQYDCTQAKLNINGRSYTIWFTYDVPYKFGPLKFHNLPGLIVEIKDDNNNLKISLINFKKTKELTDFFNIKKYVLENKHIIDYKTYESTIIKQQLENKLKYFELLREYKQEKSDFVDENIVDKFIDIPKDLLSNLKKLHYKYLIK